MKISEIEAKSILRKNRKIDSWFISGYGMNLYRGCSHNCSYCDGRAEKYNVEGAFGKEVAVKINAIEILKRELDPVRKRKPFQPGFFVVGGGVCDSYQPLEQKYQLTHQALELLKAYNHPVHLLTKSPLIERDLDLIKTINRQSRAIVSMSFSSVDDGVSSVFEPGVAPPSERLKTLKMLKNAGIACGMFLLPVIPFITDSSDMILDALKTAKEFELDYVLFGGMTLKEGRQRDHFFRALKNYQPDLIQRYRDIYPGNEWGAASKSYYDIIYGRYAAALKEIPIAGRIPAGLFRDLLDRNQLLMVILEHIDYYLTLKKIKSPYGYAAYLLSKRKEPIRTIEDLDQGMKGIHVSVKKVVQDILETGGSPLYDELTKIFVS